MAGGQAARAVIAQFQQRDQKLQDIGWRLVRGNASFCANTAPSIGLQLQDMASYGSPDAAREALGLTGDFAVQTAAAGSPAHLAGLAANQEITAIDGATLSGWTAEEKLDWKRLARAHDALDASLADDGLVGFGLADGSSLAISGVSTCPTRFELLSKSDTALADGKRVQFGAEFAGFTYPEDELAAAIAHELAHNLLGHSDWLDREGRKRKHVRLTEREADRLMPWLLANAGYDLRAASRFMAKWGPKHAGGLFRKRTHDGWDERVEFIEAEYAQIAAAQGGSGWADWSQHFLRLIEP